MGSFFKRKIKYCSKKGRKVGRKVGDLLKDTFFKKLKDGKQKRRKLADFGSESSTSK